MKRNLPRTSASLLRTRWLPPLLLLAVGAAVYSNSLDGALVYDDFWAIRDNPQIRQLWPFHELLIPSAPSPVSRRPLPALSLAVNYALGGLEVRGYHLFNLAVHGLCGLALFGIVRRTLAGSDRTRNLAPAAPEIAIASALLWLVHPLNSECVNYVVQRTESLGALFFLLTLYCVIRGTQSPRSRAWYAAAIGACALGMGSKEVMATAPPLVFLHQWIFAGRERTRSQWGLYAGLAATWGILAALFAFTPPYRGGGFGRGLGGFDYFLNQCLMVVHYLKLAFWPHPLVLDYGLPRDVTIVEALPFASLLLGIGGATLVALWRRPALGFLGCAFFVALAPSSSFVPIPAEVGAERRMYLPLAPIAVAVSVLVWTLAARLSRRARWLAPALIAAAVIALGLTTYARNPAYRDPGGLWKSTVDVRPRNFRARTELGNVLRAEGDVTGALAQYREALRIEPRYAYAHYNLATLLSAEGRGDEAAVHYAKALKEDPELEQAHYNLGVWLRAQGRTSEAIDHYRRAVALDPSFSEAHYNLGVALETEGDAEQAAFHYRRAIETRPGFAKAHYGLALLHERAGEPDAAILHYRKAIEGEPGFGEAHHNLALLLRSRGQGREAVHHFREALRTLGNDPRIHYGLALTLQSQNDLAGAVTHYRRALELAPDLFEAYNNLASILYAQGETKAALEQFEQALRLDPDAALPLVNVAWILALHPDPSVRDPGRALELAERAAGRAGQDAAMLARLADVFAAVGRSAEARAVREDALALAAKRGHRELERRLKEKLDSDPPSRVR